MGSGGTSGQAEQLHRSSRWLPYEVELNGRRTRADPYNEVDVSAILIAPDGREIRVPGFWDGGSTWRIRASPDMTGMWRWSSECSDVADTGLHGQSGAFECLPYEGDLELFRHGPIRVSPDGRRFAHADGTPFFWLADTCWNGILRSTQEDWHRYLDVRRRQGFNVIHHFSMTWRGLPSGRGGRRAFDPGPPIRVDPEFFQPLDERIVALNGEGFVAAPIMVLALYAEDEGSSLPEDALVRLARYLLARWNAYQVVWTLGGDGDFAGERAGRWCRVGQAIDGERPGRLMSMHPKGLSWDADEFRQEAWFDFLEYQSCHFAAPEAIAWMVEGPLPAEWRSSPARPIVNVEPNYEEHPALDTGYVFSDRDVRRAAYWSVLLSPTAGVSYGNFHVWSWSDRPEDFRLTLRDMSSGWIPIGPWHEHLDTPGAHGMTLLRDYLATGRWYRLEPAPYLLASQPGTTDPGAFQAAACTVEKDWAVVYLPDGREVDLAAPEVWSVARWYDPRDGTWRPAIEQRGRLHPPDDRDWLLDLRR